MEKRNQTYRLYPKTPYKANMLIQSMGACRAVWNHFLDKHKSIYDLNKAFAEPEATSKTYFSLGVEFTALRRENPEWSWLLDLPANPIKHVLKYQADA